MSNYNSLKTTIDANIKQNGNQEITGQILNSVLNAMVNTLGTGYQFAGVATTATNPGSPDAKVFYIANGKGTYTNFGGIEVTEDEVVFLYWDSSWHKVSTGIASQGKLTELKEKVDALALGAFYGYFPDSSSLPVDMTTPGYAYVGLDNPYKIWNFNGKSWSDSGTSIDMNDADEEDLTRNTDGKLQFKDRSYGDGMGYVILRKDKTFAEQVTQANTIYEIRYDFDLDGKRVPLPSNCVLKFNGGRLLNTSFQGRVSNEYVRPEWFGAIGDGITDDTLAIQAAINICESVVFAPKTYLVSNQHNVSYKDFYALTLYKGKHYLYGNNATIKLADNDLQYYAVLRVTSTESTIIDNFTIIGDKDNHIDPTEFGFGILVEYGNNFVNIRNCDISKMIGDAIIVDKYYSTEDDSKTIVIEKCTLHHCRRQGISLLNGTDVFIKDCILSNIEGTNPGSGIDIEPVAENLLRTTISGCHFIDCKRGLITALNSLTGEVDTINVDNCDFKNCEIILTGADGVSININGVTTTGKSVSVIDNPSRGYINIDACCYDVKRESTATPLIYMGSGKPVYNVKAKIYLTEAQDSPTDKYSIIFGSNDSTPSDFINCSFSIFGKTNSGVDNVNADGCNLAFETLGFSELSNLTGSEYLSQRYCRRYVCSRTPIFSGALLVVANTYRGEPIFFEVVNKHSERIIINVNGGNKFLDANSTYVFYLDNNGHTEEITHYSNT